MTHALHVEDAVVRFGERVALDHLELSVERGEVVAVLGPSGCGKTTLLRSIAGLQRLDEGAVVIDGTDQRDVPPHRRGVGLMFQDHALFPHRDVAGNVGFGLRMLGCEQQQIAARTRELLELVGLPSAERRAVTTLSGGEQQRVALARALAPRPRILLLDEPLGSLDRTLRDHLVRELRALFVSLRQTVVAVTHDHDEAFALADRIAVVDAGRVLQTGTPQDVWSRPSSARVAHLLGFPSVVTETGRTVVVRPDAIRVDPTGPLVGEVVERGFVAGQVRLVVRVSGGRDVDVLVEPPAAPDLGERVHLAVDPGGVVELG